MDGDQRGRAVRLRDDPALRHRQTKCSLSAGHTTYLLCPDLLPCSLSVEAWGVALSGTINPYVARVAEMAERRLWWPDILLIVYQHHSHREQGVQVYQSPDHTTQSHSRLSK